MALEFAAKVRRIPVYPAADGYALGGPGRQARLQRDAVPAAARGRRGGHDARSAASTATRTRRTPRCARGSRDRYGVPANRIAIGNGSCDILLAAGEALLEPGAELVYAWPSFSVYPHLAAASGARAIEVPLDAEHRHDLDAMREEITVATRLVIVCNPNNPTSTALPLEEIAALRRRRPAPRRRDPRRGLLRVQHARRTPTSRSTLLERHPNLVLLRTFSKVYGLCGLRVGFALCGSEELPHRGRPGPPAVLLQRRRAGRRARGAQPPGRGRPPRRAQPRRADRARGRAAPRSASSPPSRRPTSSGSTSRRATTTSPPTSSARSSGLAQRGILVRAGGALGRAGALRVTVGTEAENERFLDALAALLPPGSVAADKKWSSASSARSR